MKRRAIVSQIESGAFYDPRVGRIVDADHGKVRVTIEIEPDPTLDRRTTSRLTIWMTEAEALELGLPESALDGWFDVEVKKAQ